MKAVDHKVNIVPIIAKADTLTQQEIRKLKKKVRQLACYKALHDLLIDSLQHATPIFPGACPCIIVALYGTVQVIYWQLSFIVTIVVCM